MTRQQPRPDRPDRGLFLVATDVVGRTSILAGPYPTPGQAAARVRAVVACLVDAPALAGFGHVTVAEGAVGSATYFGRV